jgi:hypothetical protein
MGKLHEDGEREPSSEHRRGGDDVDEFDREDEVHLAPVSG